MSAQLYRFIRTKVTSSSSFLWLVLVFYLSFSTAVSAQSSQVASSTEEAHLLLQRGQAKEALDKLLELHSSRPTDPTIAHLLGLAYTKLQNLPSAAEFYRKALTADQSFVAARKNLAVVLWFLNNKKESEREFRAVTGAVPDDPVPHLYLGVAEYERKAYVQAKTHFDKADGLAVNNPEVLPMVLECYLATDDLSVPSRLMKQLVEAKNPNPNLIFDVGKLLGQYGFYDEAAEAFAKITRIHPDPHLVLLNLGWAQLRNGEVKAATRTLEGIAHDDRDTRQVNLLLAEAYEKQEMVEPAYRFYVRAVDSNPADAEAYVALAKFASAHQNNPFALKILEQGLQRIPGSAELLLQRGVTWALQGNTAKAEQSFVAASQAKPRWSVPLLALGVAQLESGQWNEAASTFRKAAKIAPDDFRPEYLYAEALTRVGDPQHEEKIMTALMRAVALSPHDARPRVSLAQAYLSTGAVAEAVAELEKALDIDPENTEALYKLGMTYRRQGNKADAEELLEKFRELKAKVKDKEPQVIQILKIVGEDGAPRE